ncbi:apolipoprotein N-acyltransferase [Parapedobacter tibetensis]|uniref:apolipoprotein N-acyltransferase n=1 Tax=Parapedobacter tibetensis TaxID=2972951 RepID=UPI00214D518B|nr:apolipoprotein N-acyltransferase [Parapedobacter tibetensis]
MRTNYLLALLSAFLLWVAWPPIPYTAPLLWVGFVPLLLAMEDVMRGQYRKKGTKIFLLGGSTGLLWNTASIYWVFNSLDAVMPVYAAAFVSLIPFGLAAVLMAIAFRLYYQLRKRHGIGLSLVGLVCFWIAYEYLHQTWDLAFPWMTLGNGFASTHQLVQWYEYTGVFGGTVWIWAPNILVFLTILSAKDGFAPAHRYKLLGGLAALILIPSTWSLYRYFSYEEHENPSDVVVVQPNIDPYGKFGFIPPAEQIEDLIRLSESVAQPNTEFFIWPETAIAHSFGYDEEQLRQLPIFHRIQDFLSRYKNSNLLSGIESFRIFPEQHTPTAFEYQGIYYDKYNAAVLIENSARLQFYHKSKLVPGVEQTPFGGALAFMKPLFKAFGGTTGGYGRQEKPSVFYSQSGIGAAPVICYESIWGDYVAQYIKQGAQFIAVVTNDGWWGNTSGKDQHLAYAKLRAIETRRWVARSANTGISAFINQRGDVVQKTKWWVADAIKQDINLNEEITCYVKAGDYFAYAGCIGSLVFGLLIVIGRRWRSAKS